MTPTLWLTNGSKHLRARAVWAAIFAFVALFVGLAATPPPPRTPEGVAAMLGASVAAEVRADDFVWEARGGFWSDAFLGRRVLFLARRPGATHADLFRARVLLTRAGRPLRVRVVQNLSQSPLGDERDLVAQGHHAAYVTHAFGAVQGITLLDLDGDGEPAPRSLVQRVSAAVDRWLATGSPRGVGRTEITFGAPPPEARHELQGDLLVISLGKEAVPASLDLRDGALNVGAQNPFAASVQRIPRPAARPADVFAGAVTELFGQSAGGAALRVAASLDAIGKRVSPAKRVQATFTPSGSPAPTGDAFPPPALTPVAVPALSGEGAWTTRSNGTNGLPPFAFETAIRPDSKAPDALVHIVALDTRQIDLRLTPGAIEPRSPSGLHGSGRPPEGVPPDRIVAVFASGPAAPRAPDEAAHGVAELGFAVDRRVLAPPIPGRATIAIADDGRAALGAWPFGADLAPPFVSLRQVPAAILGGDARTVDGEARERSALGLSPSGQLFYAWSAHSSADALARALTLAGCSYAVPLAAGPSPSGFAFLREGSPAALLAPAMSLSPEQIAGRSPNDLFYVVLRGAVSQASSGGASLAPDKGTQPSPAWLPAIQTSVMPALGAQIHVTTFAPGRLSFRLRAGNREPATKAAAALPSAMPDADLPKILASIGLGTAKRRHARGLVVDGQVGFPLRGDDAGLLVLEQGRPRIVKSTGAAPSTGVDATELPLTADDGKLRAEARDVGTMRSRAAACVLDDGTFAVARVTFDSDEAATTALLELGCSRVVALDRGAHRDAYLHRAGTDSAPQARYETSTLFAIEAPLSGRAAPLAAP